MSSGWTGTCIRRCTIRATMALCRAPWRRTAILCVGKGNPRYKDVWNYSEIYPHMLKEITHFFAIYKDLEGKRVEVKGWRDASVARSKVAEAQQRFIDNKVNPEPKPVKT